MSRLFKHKSKKDKLVKPSETDADEVDAKLDSLPSSPSPSQELLPPQNQSFIQLTHSSVYVGSACQDLDKLKKIISELLGEKNVLKFFKNQNNKTPSSIG